MRVLVLGGTAEARAAHLLGLPVVIVRRPPEPIGAAVVETVDDALTTLDDLDACERGVQA